MKSLLVGMLGVLFMSPFNISGESMEPLLNNSDIIMFESFAYMVDSPKRKDVVVFYGTDEPDKIFVKRIIGLPGETVLLKEGKVFIIDKDGNKHQLKEDYLTKSNKEYSLRQIDGTSYKVPEGKYFMLGDNRNNSFDSRTWHDPFIPKENLVGKYYFGLF
ncbi:signal peptidase I [bacterium]|nr:signal peptidase I [bacterium]